MREFHTIVEFSFNPKKKLFVVRFKNGTILKVPIEHLPTEYQSKKIKWDQAEINKDSTALKVQLGRKKLEIPAYILYSSGKTL